MTYRIEPTFKKRLLKKPLRLREAILETISRLDDQDEPKGKGLHVERIRSRPGQWSARVDQANRVAFIWEGSVRVFLNHCNHQAVYGRD